jgi:hypothetical protein
VIRLWYGNTSFDPQGTGVVVVVVVVVVVEVSMFGCVCGGGGVSNMTVLWVSIDWDRISMCEYTYTAGLPVASCATYPCVRCMLTLENRP